MAHDPSMGFADYFSAADAAASSVGTLMPEMDEGPPELYGLQAGMELLGMRGLAATSSSVAASSTHGHGLTKAMLMNEQGADDGSTMRFFMDHHHHQQQQQHSHPSQAPLSLSLCRPEDVLQQQHLGGGSSRQQHQMPAAWMQMHDTSPHGHGAAWHLRSSRFLLPAQQLLQRFCNLPVADRTKRPSNKAPSTTQQEDGGGAGDVSSSSSPLTPSAQIQAMDALELQRLKDKLYVMLEEVDRRYRRYCEQMRALAGGFEAVAGERAAAGYTALASRTISRHFRNLRDGIVGQLQAVRKALGEKDVSGSGSGSASSVPGMTRGQTPRLKVLDQCIRQHKAMHQNGMMESHPWRPQRGLPERAVTILRAWLFEHFLHPYPSDVDKHILARQTGLSRSQVSNWFINARVRLWKPMVEEMYVEEMKLEGGAGMQQAGAGAGLLNPNPSSNNSGSGSNNHASVDVLRRLEGEGGGGDERKPTPGQLHMIHDAGSLASVVHTSAGAARMESSFGIMDHLDFDAYDDGGGQGAGSVSGGGGVSLTLGLQQHDSHDGVNIAFGPPPPSAHGGGGFVFPAGDVVGHGHHIQFGTAGMVDAAAEAASSHGGQDQHYPRGLSSGFHLLRDLAG